MEVIDTYSRAEALKEGRLLDITGDAIAAGIHYPTAITSGVCRWIARAEDQGDLTIAARRFQALLSLVVKLDLIATALAEPGRAQPFGIAWHLNIDLFEIANFKVVCAIGNEGDAEVTILLDEDIFATLH